MRLGARAASGENVEGKPETRAVSRKKLQFLKEARPDSRDREENRGAVKSKVAVMETEDAKETKEQELEESSKERRRDQRRRKRSKSPVAEPRMH